MPSKAMSAKKGAITVAVIGAIATLGAAILSNSSKEQSPSINQFASGNGSVNAGRDAVITNNNITKSAGEEAAERVQACEAQHAMKVSSEKTSSLETIPAKDGSPAEFIEHVSFRSCTWPKLRYADADGYLEIKVQSVQGPGEGEASGMDYADRIAAPCKQLKVAYQYGHMGVYENRDPFTINANSIVTLDGEPWKNEQGALPFYPDAGEFVVLHNGHNGISSADCV